MSTTNLATLTRLARDDLDARRELARLLRRHGDPRGNMLEQACTAPSPAKWTRLLELADAQPAHDHRALVYWLAPFAAHWPEHLRLPLASWLRTLAADAPLTLAQLCRKLVTERSTTPMVLRHLLDHRALRALTGLEIGFNELEGQAARVVATCPLRNLHTLSLTWCGLGPDEIRTLTSWDGMRRLVCLDVSHNEIGQTGTAMLTAPEFPGALASLTLSYNLMRDEGIAPLTTDTGLHSLEHLALRGNGLTPAGAAELGDSPGLPALRDLDLAENLLGDEGARALATCSLARQLHGLDLTETNITDAGAVTLATSPALAGLRRLVLWKNPIGPDGKDALRVWKKAVPGRALVI